MDFSRLKKPEKTQSLCDHVVLHCNQTVVEVFFLSIPLIFKSSNLGNEIVSLTVSVLSTFLAAHGEQMAGKCSYQDVLNHLNLSRNNELFSMSRPVKDYKQPTQVTLELLLYAILDVVSVKHCKHN